MLAALRRAGSDRRWPSSRRVCSPQRWPYCSLPGRLQAQTSVKLVSNDRGNLKRNTSAQFRLGSRACRS